jgi:hypothetical protein
MNHVIVLAVLAVGCGASGGKKSAVMHKPVELPVTMIEDRFFLETKTVTGAPLRLNLDSAGEMVLTRQAVDRLKLAITRDGDRDTVEFPRFYDARVPRPLIDACPVLGLDEAPRDGSDGKLGAPWFAERVFTFDYAAKQVLFRAPGDLPQVAAAHRLALGEARDDARIPVEVDGAAIEMRLDTGATVVLSDAAKQQLGGAATERATSFVSASVFDRWHRAHPEWRVIDPRSGEAGRFDAMIEVPRVKIAGYDIGPVWFTRRPEDALHDADGALGGSALRLFRRVTFDWANAVAVFEAER